MTAPGWAGIGDSHRTAFGFSRKAPKVVQRKDQQWEEVEASFRRAGLTACADLKLDKATLGLLEEQLLEGDEIITPLFYALLIELGRLNAEDPDWEPPAELSVLKINWEAGRGDGDDASPPLERKD